MPKRKMSSQLKSMQLTRMRNAKPPPKPESGGMMQLGRNGRDSVINPDRPDRQYYRLHAIRPRDKTKQFSAQRITLDDLYAKPIAEVLALLIQSSDVLSRATRIKIRYLVKKYSLESPENDQAAIDIIENFIDRMETSGKSFLGELKRIGYGIVVEGAHCSELIFSEDGSEPIKISYVSPLSLSFELTSAPGIGEYYLIGQRIRRDHRITVLQDEANPNDTFIYDPTFQLGDDPYGSSEMAPACFGVAAMSDLLATMVDFIQGRVFPKHIYQVDLEALEPYQYTKAELEQAAKIAEDLITGKLSAADITQDVVLTTPIIATLVGAMERANIDGIEVLMDSFQTIAERGAGVPRVFMGGRRARGGLNDNESDIEMLDFYDDSIDKQEQMTANISKHFTTILRHEGNTSHVNLVLESANTQIEKIKAEAFDIAMTGYTKLKQLEVLQEDELRTKVLSQSFDLSDLLEVDEDELDALPDETEELIENALAALTDAREAIALADPKALKLPERSKNGGPYMYP